MPTPTTAQAQMLESIQACNTEGFTLTLMTPFGLVATNCHVVIQECISVLISHLESLQVSLEPTEPNPNEDLPPW